MLAKIDRERAFEVLTLAGKYANASPAKVEPPKTPPIAFGLDTTIAGSRAKIGVYPESLSELKLESSLVDLALADWFRADQIVNQIRDDFLRLLLKLLLAGAVIEGDAKARGGQKECRAGVANSLPALLTQAIAVRFWRCRN
jgi:hypothetical protein